MSCARSHALQRAVETLKETLHEKSGLPNLPLPHLRPVFDGPDVHVQVAGRTIAGRLSGHRVLASEILGALMGVPDEPHFRCWLPSLRAGGRRRFPSLHPGDLWAREALLAEPMRDAGLAWLAAGEEQEGLLCLRRVARGSPEHPSRVETPWDPRAPDAAVELQRVLNFTGRLLAPVPAPLRESSARPVTHADEAVRGRGKALTTAITAVSPFATHPDPIERAATAEKLGGILAEINLGRTDPVPASARAGAVLEPLLEDVPFVQEPAFNALTVVAERLHGAGRYREALPWLDRAVETGLLLRENLAMRFEARWACGDRAGAEADWRRATALQAVWPPGGIRIEDDAYDESPEAGRARARAEERALAATDRLAATRPAAGATAAKAARKR